MQKLIQKWQIQNTIRILFPRIIFKHKTNETSVKNVMLFSKFWWKLRQN